MPKCYYFGCWNTAGHYLTAPGGIRSHEDRVSRFSGNKHLDGNLAPRKRKDGGLCWSGQGNTQNERIDISYKSSEYPQGQFLLHHLDNGYTAIQWWDRTQGDERGACNSTILLEGIHDSSVMIEALKTYFPSVYENMRRNGVELVEVIR